MPAAAATRRAAPAKPGRRRPARTARTGSIRWDRVGRIGLLTVLGVILLLYISPAKNWIQQSRAAGAQQQELRDLQRRNRSLKHRVGALRQPTTLDHQARRLGMVGPRERSFVIENLPK
jgi:cell division protein FtsB